jgi:hypothetical protein
MEEWQKNNLQTLNIMIDSIDKNVRINDRYKELLKFYKARALEYISSNSLSSDFIFIDNYASVIKDYITNSNDYRVLMSIMNINEKIAREVRSYRNYKSINDTSVMIDQIIELLKKLSKNHFNTEIYLRDLNDFLAERREVHFTEIFLQFMHAELSQRNMELDIAINNGDEKDGEKEDEEDEKEGEKEEKGCVLSYTAPKSLNKIFPAQQNNTNNSRIEVNKEEEKQGDDCCSIFFSCFFPRSIGVTTVLPDQEYNNNINMMQNSINVSLIPQNDEMIRTTRARDENNDSYSFITPYNYPHIQQLDITGLTDFDH